MEARILGLSGPARAGKSSLAHLLTEYGGYRQIAFATPIKKIVADLVGRTPEELEISKDYPLELLGGRTPREAMQTLGDWGRKAIADSLWVDRAIASAMPLIETGDRVVFTDVRIQNEAQAIANLGGFIIRVARDSLPEASGRDHDTEIPLPPSLIDGTVWNVGSELETYRQAEELIERFSRWHRPVREQQFAEPTAG